MCSMTSIIPLPALQTGSVTQLCKIQPELCCNTNASRCIGVLGNCFCTVLWSDMPFLAALKLSQTAHWLDVGSYRSDRVHSEGDRPLHITLRSSVGQASDWFLLTSCYICRFWLDLWIDGKKGDWVRSTVWTETFTFLVTGATMHTSDSPWFTLGTRNTSKKSFVHKSDYTDCATCFWFSKKETACRRMPFYLITFDSCLIWLKHTFGYVFQGSLTSLIC